MVAGEAAHSRAEDDAAHHLLGLAGHAAAAKTRPDKRGFISEKEATGHVAERCHVLPGGVASWGHSRAADPRPDQTEGAAS